MSGRLYLDEIYSKSGQTKVLDTTSFDANNNFEASNTGFNLNYQSANAALNIVQSGTGDALRVNSNSLVVDSNGNVGIGTSSPSYNIDVKGSTGISAQRATDTDRLIMQWDGLTSYGNSVGAYNNIKFISQNNSGSVERMRINSSGYVTKPYQPAFEARTYDNGTNNGYYPSAGQVEVVTPYVNVTNIGNHFDLQNNRFTAPISGMYVIGFNFYYSPASGNYIGGVINISTGRYIYAFSSPGSDVNATYSTCIYLTQNDWVRFLTYCGDASSRLYNSSTVYGYFLG